MRVAVLKLAAHEEVVLAGRTPEDIEGGESSIETPQLSETMKFEYRS